MRKLLLPLLGVAALATTAFASQLHKTPSLQGEWVGTGDFFQSELRQQNGVLACTLRFAQDESSGAIGAATLQDIRVHDEGTYLQVSARLSEPASPALRTKEYVIFVITLLNDSTMHGEVHFKSNRIYDIRMREAKLAMRRAGGK